MPYQLTISPDFPPSHIAGWYIFNTWLQKELGVDIHLELYNDFDSQRDAIRADKVDIIYANPYDAAMLVREKGFKAIAHPSKKNDEAMIVVHADNPVEVVEDLQPGIRIAQTEDPDVNLISMIMLEPADLNAENIQLQTVGSYALVAKQLIQNTADVGFFLKDAYEGLTNITTRNLKILVESEIGVIHHALLIGPRLADKRQKIQTLLTDMHNSPKGKNTLTSCGFDNCEALSQEEVEFMIDLMDTLG